MGNKHTKIEALLIGAPKSGKSYFLNKLSAGMYIPKFCNNTIQIWHGDYTRINIKEYNDVSRPIRFKFDVIMVILKCDSTRDIIFETKNMLLQIYAVYKKPICIIHNQITERENDIITFEKRNELLQINHFDSILTCVLNFKDKECGNKFESILKWIVKKTANIVDDNR